VKTWLSDNPRRFAQANEERLLGLIDGEQRPMGREQRQHQGGDHDDAIELALIGCLLLALTAALGPAAGFAVQAAADTARHHFRPARRNPG
jgi:hypothetical protein